MGDGGEPVGDAGGPGGLGRHEGSNDLPCGGLLCLLGPAVNFDSLDDALMAAGGIL